MPTNDYIISLLLEWANRVEQSAEERRRLAEEREETELRAVQIDEEQEHWNYDC